MFILKSPFKPTGDQPQAIKKLVKNLKDGVTHQVLLGVTGSGKTFSIASTIAQIQKPILVISPNKTLAAQLYQEFKEFFPENGVHYFVSYYDYYQPEAYIPQTDTYIEKDAKINEEIDRLRHSAIQDLLNRNDIIIVASVSCIYNIGSPENYQKVSLEIKAGQKIQRKDLISSLVSLQYQRNDFDLKPGFFRVRANKIEISLVTGKEILRIDFSKDGIDKILIASNSLNPVYKEISLRSSLVSRFAQNKILNTKYRLYPAHFWIAPKEKLNISLANIKMEMEEQIKKFKKQGKLLEAERLEQKTNYDLEMLKENGYCHGIENYSSHLEFREPGTSPYTLIDYLKMKDSQFVIFADESHQTLPQIKAMSVQDKVRKEMLINHGFRLPSALDNRPLTYKEFEEKTNQIVYVSATPSYEEKIKSGEKYIIHQTIRPTGLLEPSIEIRPSKNQINDLVEEIKKRIKKDQRVLALTLTKKMAESLSEYLEEKGIKSQWVHSEIKTLDRPEILKNLRQGKCDVLVGINLLREGLDLPEVSLVAILDADKEGFLRNDTTLIQIMGRAARHIDGHIILYADKKTKSMEKAIYEIERRRKIQEDYNKKNNITPIQIQKEIRDWSLSSKKDIGLEFSVLKNIKLLEKEMKLAAKDLNFERAAQIRDLIAKTKKHCK